MSFVRSSCVPLGSSNHVGFRYANSVGKAIAELELRRSVVLGSCKAQQCYCCGEALWAAVPAQLADSPVVLRISTAGLGGRCKARLRVRNIILQKISQAGLKCSLRRVLKMVCHGSTAALGCDGCR